MEVVTDLIFSIDAQPRKEEYKKGKKGKCRDFYPSFVEWSHI